MGEVRILTEDISAFGLNGLDSHLQACLIGFEIDAALSLLEFSSQLCTGGQKAQTLALAVTL